MASSLPSSAMLESSASSCSSSQENSSLSWSFCSLLNNKMQRVTNTMNIKQNCSFNNRNLKPLRKIWYLSSSMFDSVSISGTGRGKLLTVSWLITPVWYDWAISSSRLIFEQPLWEDPWRRRSLLKCHSRNNI